MSKRKLFLVLPLLVLASAIGAWAYWTTTGAGTGQASTGTLTAPGQPTRTGSGSTVDLNWTASTVSGGGTISYHVERSTDPVTTWSDACGTTVSSGTTSTSCTDSTAAGTYRYRVTAIFATWTAVSPVSDACLVTPSDTTAPSVTAIDRADASPTNVGTVHWTVTFSESVSGVDASDFALVQAGGVSGAAITGVSGSGPYTVTATTGSNSGTLGLNLVDDDSIQDVAGNKLGGTGTSGAGDGSFTGQVYTIDKTNPSVTLTVPADGSATNDTTPTLSGAAGNAAGDSATVTVKIYNGTGTGGSVAQTIPVTRSGAAWTVDAAVLAQGTYTAQATQTDTAGNTGTSSANTFTVDTTAPGVTLTAPADGSATNDTTPTLSGAAGNAAGDSATVTVKIYNGTGTGGSVAQTIPVTRSGAAWTVDAAVLAQGTYTAQATQTDTVGNSGTSSANTFTVDTTPPTVTVNQKAAQADPTNALPILFTVTFSESVTGFDASDLTRTGTSTGGTVAVTGSGASYEISLTGTPTNGTITFSIAANKAQDLAGNNNALSTSTDNIVTYDTSTPTLSTLHMFDTNGNGKVDQAKATFNETLNTSYSAPNTVWTLGNAPGGGGNTISSVSVSGAVATITLNEGNVNTAPGTYSGTALSQFTIALVSNANGVRDAAGNQSSFSTTPVTDKAAPIPTSLAFANGAGSAAANTPDKGDTIDVAFSEPLAVASMCSTWSGDTSNQTSISGNGAPVTFRFVNNGVPVTAFDQFIVQSITGGNCASFSFGSIDLGSQGYVIADQTSSGSGGSASQILWTFATRTARFTLGSVNNTSAVTTNPTATYTPGSGMTDIAGNAASGTISHTGNHF